MTDANQARYLKVVEWARKRYTHGGVLIVSIGGKPSAYTKIEEAAWRRYTAT